MRLVDPFPNEDSAITAGEKSAFASGEDGGCKVPSGGSVAERWRQGLGGETWIDRLGVIQAATNSKVIREEEN